MDLASKTREELETQMALQYNQMEAMRVGLVKQQHTLEQQVTRGSEGEERAANTSAELLREAARSEARAATVAADALRDATAAHAKIGALEEIISSLKIQLEEASRDHEAQMNETESAVARREKNIMRETKAAQMAAAEAERAKESSDHGTRIL